MIKSGTEGLAGMVLKQACSLVISPFWEKLKFREIRFTSGPLIAMPECYLSKIARLASYWTHII